MMPGRGRGGLALIFAAAGPPEPYAYGADQQGCHDYDCECGDCHWCVLEGNDSGLPAKVEPRCGGDRPVVCRMNNLVCLPRLR